MKKEIRKMTKALVKFIDRQTIEESKKSIALFRGELDKVKLFTRKLSVTQRNIRNKIKDLREKFGINIKMELGTKTDEFLFEKYRIYPTDQEKLMKTLNIEKSTEYQFIKERFESGLTIPSGANNYALSV